MRTANTAIGKFLLLFTIFAIFQINAEEDASSCPCEETVYFPRPQAISIGPEIYHIRRVREGGSKQSGCMYGVRLSYNMIKRYKVYWGAEFLWAKGDLCGKTGGGIKLKSKFTDENLEGRIGYTFQCKNAYQPFLTPFVGYGYFLETNNYVKPSPMLIHFQNRYKYFVGGFLSGFSPAPEWIVGFNFKAMPMWQAKCKVTNDPVYQTSKMLIKDEINYRYEMPIIYLLCFCRQQFDLRLVPFYETRHYGRRENFPFDFLDTKLRIWGADFQISYRF